MACAPIDGYRALSAVARQNLRPAHIDVEAQQAVGHRRLGLIQAPSVGVIHLRIDGEMKYGKSHSFRYIDGQQCRRTRLVPQVPQACAVQLLNDENQKINEVVRLHHPASVQSCPSRIAVPG